MHVCGYKFGYNWNSDSICWDCTASKVGDGSDYTHFKEEPQRSHETYMAHIGHRIQLCGIIGWHLSTVVPEGMHAGPLGTVPCLNGTILRSLCSDEAWDAGGAAGGWSQKMDCQLSQA